MNSEYEVDIEAAIRCVAKNYAGFEDKRARFGSNVIDAARDQALESAHSVTTHEECLRVLHTYVSVFQDGHVSALYFDADNALRNAKSLVAASTAVLRYRPPSSAPTARLVGNETILIAIPDFQWEYKAAIDVMLKEFDSELRQRPVLVLDVRGNGGGSDDCYFGLLPYLYTDPIVTIGVDILATQESADAWEAILTMVPVEETELLAQTRAEIQRMRESPEGAFIPKNGDDTDTYPEILPNPARIAIMIDGGCASTTEQFLLAARQSCKVTLLGQPTAGILDYANVRLFPLPSGKRMLGIPTTRSRRLPDFPIDNIGIFPDVIVDWNAELPDNDAEHIVERVRTNWNAE